MKKATLHYFKVQIGNLFLVSSSGKWLSKKDLLNSLVALSLLLISVVPHPSAAAPLKNHVVERVTATITAVTNGNWSNPATWGGAVPTAGDDVIIPAGITVTYNSNQFNTAHPYIEIGGTLLMGPGQGYFEFAASAAFRVLNGGVLRNASSDSNFDYFWGSTLLAVNTGVTLKVYIEAGGVYTVQTPDQIVLNNVLSVGNWGMVPASSGSHTSSFLLVGVEEDESNDYVGVEATLTGVTPPVPGGGVTPVRLVRFDAMAVNGVAVLNWETASETNTQRFDVEHSADGQNWVKRGSVDAKGNSIIIQKYSFVHGSPSSGLNYYRLKIMDYDGSFEWSDVSRINVSSSGEIRIYPLPANDYIITEISEVRKPLQYIISDVQGKTIRKGFITRNNQRITTREFVPGIYFIKVDQLAAVKFVKQ